MTLIDTHQSIVYPPDALRRPSMTSQVSTQDLRDVTDLYKKRRRGFLGTDNVVPLASSLGDEQGYGGGAQLTLMVFADSSQDLDARVLEIADDFSLFLKDMLAIPLGIQGIHRYIQQTR